jgi:hypothetical protein
VAALIIEHAKYLHRDHTPGDDAWSDFLAGLPAARDEALAAAERDIETLESDYRWLHLADLISLAFCAGWEAPFERWGLRGVVKEDTVSLAPFPLAGSTGFSVACRYLEAGFYASDAAVATALATSRWERSRLRIAPE